MIAEVARLLHENNIKLPFGLYITNSVQEEVGLRGAEMITNTLKPDVAIVTDVCHDTTTPMINQKEQGFIQMGKGPVVSYAPAVQNKLREKILDTAIAKEIPFQRLRLLREPLVQIRMLSLTATAALPSALISLPLTIHAHHCGDGS